MVDGALERRDEGASYAFGFIKKYSKLRKCEPIYYRKVKSSLAFFPNAGPPRATSGLSGVLA